MATEKEKAEQLARQMHEIGITVSVFEEHLPLAIKEFLSLVRKKDRVRKTDMYYFILYDIENNKVRTRIAKYLKSKGCVRIQKSVYFVVVPVNLFREISDTLAEIQEMYDNNDSIFFLPVGNDALQGVRCVGQQFDFQLMSESPSCLIF